MNKLKIKGNWKTTLLNLQTKRAWVWAFAALPLCLIIIGCKEKNDSSTGAASVPEPNSTVSKTDADNSRVNARDRNNANPTPLDQGNTPADRELTQRLRKSLTSGPNDYSTDAKNIKIIAENGKVTLRGPVKSEVEKSNIVAAAKSVAGDGNVQDELDVTAK